MDDLGWLALRAVQEPFTDFAARLADYGRAAGIAVDLDRLRYYRLFAELKVVILGYRRSVSNDPLAEVGNLLIYETLHNRLFADTLAEQYVLAGEPAVYIDAEPTEQQWLYDVMLTQLRDIIVPGTSDPFAKLRGKGLARIIKHLREVDRAGRAAEELELSRLEELLGSRPDSVAAGRRALADTITEKSLSDLAVVHYLRERAYLQLALMRPTMGVLAERRFDPLPDEDGTR